jgi:hypothetical protein
MPPSIRADGAAVAVVVIVLSDFTFLDAAWQVSVTPCFDDAQQY